MFVSWITATIQKLLIRRQAIAQLRAFDDHLLSDVGISREQISTVVRDGVLH